MRVEIPGGARLLVIESAAGLAPDDAERLREQAHLATARLARGEPVAMIVDPRFRVSWDTQPAKAAS